MIFFSGLGFLVPVLCAVGFLIPIFLEQWIVHRFGFRISNSVVMTVAVILPFLSLLTLDRILKKNGPTTKAVDVNTGNTVEIATTHTFMFLPVRWCAFIWMGLAICFIPALVN